MKYFTFLSLLLISSIADSQTNDVVKKLELFRLHTSDFVQNLQTPDTTLFFNYTRTITTGDSTYTETGVYDPSRPSKERWELLTINGQPASKADKETFVKTNSTNPYQSTVMVNDTTLDTDVEGNYMIVLFRLRPETVPEHLSYLNDCNGKAYISIARGRLEKVVYSSTREVNYYGIKASKLIMESSFEYISAAKSFRVFMEQVDLTVNQGDSVKQTQDTREYTGYRKIE